MQIYSDFSKKDAGAECRIQFNLVVSTNKPAVNLWKKMGFEIIGTVPDGFKNPSLGFVDTYIMHKKI